VLSQQELSDLKNLLDQEISKTCSGTPIDTAGLPMDEAISMAPPIEVDPINTFIETQLKESIEL